MKSRLLWLCHLLISDLVMAARKQARFLIMALHDLIMARNFQVGPKDQCMKGLNEIMQMVIIFVTKDGGTPSEKILKHDPNLTCCWFDNCRPPAWDFGLAVQSLIQLGMIMNEIALVELLP